MAGVTGGRQGNGKGTNVSCWAKNGVALALALAWSITAMGWDEERMNEAKSKKGRSKLVVVGLSPAVGAGDANAVRGQIGGGRSYTTASSAIGCCIGRKSKRETVASRASSPSGSGQVPRACRPD